MIDRMKSFLAHHDMCVLATSLQDNPHCSLMAYVADEDCRHVYMVTHRNSKKYSNMLRNPRVSLLVDDRCEKTPSQRSMVSALTAYGIFRALENRREKETVSRHILARHPHLEEFMSHPEAEVIGIEVTSFLLLEGVTEAYYQNL